MKIIVPCAGKSSRFPNVRPKWMLNSPNGDLMVISALKGLEITPDIEVIITILKEHEEKYSIKKGLEINFKKYYTNKLTILELDETTRSQSETVYKTLIKLNLDNESILIKDSDNFFEVKELKQNVNYVVYETLNNCENINAKNKSYIKRDRNNIIKEIKEKQVISSDFSIGGYYFNSAKKFKEYFEKLNFENSSIENEIYVSNIIEQMILEGEIFIGRSSQNYQDWGTLQDWLKYKEKISTYFIDIDGVLFENGAQYFEPYWGTTKPILENIEKVKELKRNGNYIIRTTSRTEEYRGVTEKQFKEFGLKYDQLVMGIGNGKRIIINDFSNSNPYPACLAINIERNKEDLKKMLK